MDTYLQEQPWYDTYATLGGIFVRFSDLKSCKDLQEPLLMGGSPRVRFTETPSMNSRANVSALGYLSELKTNSDKLNKWMTKNCRSWALQRIWS